MKQKIHSNLKAFREAYSISQRQLAADLHLTRSTYSNYELGARQMPPALEEAICAYFHITPRELYNPDPRVVVASLPPAQEPQSFTVPASDAVSVTSTAQTTSITSAPVVEQPTLPEAEPNFRIPVDSLVETPQREGFFARLRRWLKG